MALVPSQLLTPQGIENMLSRAYEILKDRGIPRMQFYRDVGISAGAMSQWKLGKTTPTYNSIATIADYLGLTVEELAGDCSEKAATPEGDGLDEDKQELIRLWDMVPPDVRQRELDYLRVQAAPKQAHEDVQDK